MPGTPSALVPIGFPVTRERPKISHSNGGRFGKVIDTQVRAGIYGMGYLLVNCLVPWEGKQKKGVEKNIPFH